MSKTAEAPSLADLKHKIGELKKSITEALSAKRSADAKKLRRQKRRLKAKTRTLARAKKASAPPPAAA